MTGKVSYMPDDTPGEWEDDGKLVSDVEEHSDLGGLTTYHTADVEDSEGNIHEGVVVTPPE